MAIKVTQQNQQQRTAIADAFHQAGINKDAEQVNNNETKQHTETVGTWSTIGLTTGVSQFKLDGQGALGEYLARFKDYVADNSATPEKLKAVAVERSAFPNQAGSCLVIGLKEGNHVAYFSLIVAETVIGMEPITAGDVPPALGRLARQPSDAFSNTMYKNIVTVLRQQYPDCQLYAAGQGVLPRRSSVKSDAVLTAFRNAIYASGMCLNQSLGGVMSDFSLLSVTGSKTEHLESSISFGEPTVVDAYGNPVRGDIVITTDVVQNNISGADVIGSRSNMSTIRGYMDVLYTGTGQTNAFAPRGQGETEPKFVPQFVISSMTNQMAASPALQLVTLLSAMDLSQNNAWVGGFNPNQCAERPDDMRDVGAVGYQANMEGNPNGIGSKIDTRSDAFANERTFNDFMRYFFKPSMLIALDVSVMGGENWYNGMFSAAANGDKGAINGIVSAANALTDGFFGQLFFAGNNSPRIFAGKPVLMHQGYYRLPDGTSRDVRDCDYLAVANHFGASNPEEMAKWNWSMCSTSSSDTYRLMVRDTVMGPVLGGSVNYTGWCHRVTFSSHFISCLARAAVECGYSVRLAYHRAENGYQATVGGDYLQAAMMSPNTGNGMYGNGPSNAGVGSSDYRVGNNFTTSTYGKL